MDAFDILAEAIEHTMEVEGESEVLKFLKSYVENYGGMRRIMNIYLITAKNHGGYDTYDSAVVIAESEDAARVTCPSDFYRWVDGQWHFVYADGAGEPDSRDDWPNNPLDHGSVEVRLVGIASPDSEPGVVCSSYNAG